MTGNELLDHIENIETSLAVLVRLSISQALERMIKDEDEKKVYELTGEKGRDDICKLLHLSPNKVSELWSNWYSAGIIRKEGLSYKKIIE